MSIIIIFAYLLRTISALSYHLFWWDMKEWRVDRMKIHLTETYQGKRWMFGPLSLVKWVLLVFMVLPFPFKSFVVYLVYIVYIAEAGKLLVKLANQRYPRPFIRPRVIGIFIFAMLADVMLTLLVSFDYPRALALLVGDKALPFLIVLLVLFSSVPFNWHKKRLIRNATLKMKNNRKIRVIGITGSYGKTTTKDMLYEILRTKHRVFRTEKSQNSDIGIAEKILRTNVANYDIFVCEMAAYKQGEIASSASILKGKIAIGIVTGINEQHQSMYKSLETTKRAKFELVKAIKNGGIALFNGEDMRLEEMIAWAKKRNIKVKKALSSKTDAYSVKLPGKHFKQNLSLAIEAAKSIGMKKKDIRKAVASLYLPQKTMNKTRKNNFLLINDTFNANPDGVYRALDYLKKQKKPRILVLQPLIELGGYAESIHETIGEQAACICDYIILTNNNFNKGFMRGVSKVEKGERKVQVNGKFPRVKQAAVLFEGKEAERYYDALYV